MRKVPAGIQTMSDEEAEPKVSGTFVAPTGALALLPRIR
jgi:hypothetical protein